MLQLNRTQSARAGKMGGMSKYTKGQYHLLVKYTKRAGRNFTASNSADAVSSAPGRFARDGSTGRYPDQETAEGSATFFRTHVENVLFAEDEHRAQNNVLKSGGGAVSTPSAPTAVVREKLPREAAPAPKKMSVREAAAAACVQLELEQKRVLTRAKAARRRCCGRGAYTTRR